MLLKTLGIGVAPLPRSTAKLESPAAPAGWVERSCAGMSTAMELTSAANRRNLGCRTRCPPRFGAGWCSAGFNFSAVPPTFGSPAGASPRAEGSNPRSRALVRAGS